MFLSLSLHRVYLSYNTQHNARFQQSLQRIIFFFFFLINSFVSQLVVFFRRCCRCFILFEINY